MKKPTVSFEYFPPKNETIEKALWEAVPVLAGLDPQFMTVTYGAGGSTRDGTLATIKKMQATGIPIAAHLTFINSTQQDLKALTDEWWENGIHHIVALRGDMPDGLQWPLDCDGDYFQYTSDFVEALKSWHDFEISVGCYPEKHPDASCLNSDIEALKKKCTAGADRAITQFFFDNECFYTFRDKCDAAGITTPICPGLLPIHDFGKMCSFAAKCEAQIPDWLHEKFAGLDDKPEDALKLATDLLTEQVRDLAANGVDHIHFYTMNKSDITSQACEAIGYRCKAA